MADDKRIEIIAKIKCDLIERSDTECLIREWLHELGEEFELIEKAINELKRAVKDGLINVDSKQKDRINIADDILLDVEYKEWGGGKKEIKS